MLALEAPKKEYVKDVIDGKYELSKSGVLVNKRTRKVRRGHLDKNGYIIDFFWVDGKQIAKYRHRLVWEAFNGEIPKGMQVNHISECKTENFLENLNLMTPKENVNWGTGIERMAKTKSKSVIQKTLDGKIIKVWPSTMEIQRELGYDHGNIGYCCRGERKTAYGYKWEYYKKR